MPLTKAEVLVLLSIADGRRKGAAQLGNVSVRTIQRSIRAHGIKHLPDARRKLHADQVREIRHCGGTLASTGKRFGVTQYAVRKIRLRETWKGVK